MKNLQDYLRIGEAAEFLGVSQQTLRNWEEKGKIRVYRHPMNRYRLFREKDLERLLERLEESATRGAKAGRSRG